MKQELQTIMKLLYLLDSDGEALQLQKIKIYNAKCKLHFYLYKKEIEIYIIAYE